MYGHFKTTFILFYTSYIYIFKVMSSQELKQIEECYIDGGKYFSF